MSKKRLLSRSEVEVATWFERDRAHVQIRDKKTQQKTIAEWWDDDARQMFEDGFFIRGLGFERSLLDYAEEVGLIAKSGGVRRNPSGAPNMVWTRYLSIALRRIYRVSAPRRISSLPGWVSIQTGTRLVIDALRKKFGAMDYHDPRVQTVIEEAKSMEIQKNPSVRRNIFTFNNPGNAQRVLAENFVKGANSGVASSMYIHGNRIYSYGPHFPIAERHTISTTPLAGTPVIIITNRKSPSKTTAGQIGIVKGAAQAAGMEIMYEELKPEAKGPAAYSNPGVRRNIFTFNNPRKLNEMEQAAVAVGLSVTTWAPGDGVTRYRFFKKSPGTPYSDYHQGDGLYTALGRKDAMAFIAAYGKGRSARTNPKSSGSMYVIEGFTHQGRRGQSKRYGAFRTPSFEKARARAEQIFQETGSVVAITQKNPLTRSEAGYLLRHAKADVTEAGAARRFGLTHEAKYAAGHARGIGFAVQETGPKAAKRAWVTMHTTLDRVLRNPPPCSNPVIRGDKLPPHLKAEVLRQFIYRWTSENQQRESAWGRMDKPRIPLISDAQWLREHAFHVTKDGRLSLKHHHAEPYYMADDWKKGDPAPNPLTRREAAGEIREIRHARDLELRAGSPMEREWQQGYKYGIAGAVYRRGPQSARRAVQKAVRQNPLLQTIGLVANPGSVKTFNEMQDVGKAKYVVNYHDGVKVHRDGSPFFDIAIFSSRAKKDRFVRKLESLGFTRGALRNPPISATWDRLTGRQREALLEVVGYDRDYSVGMVRSPWSTLSSSAKRKLEAGWLDTSYRSTGETTRRRYAPVGANPLTRKESAHVLRRAREEIQFGRGFVPGPTRYSSGGKALARAEVVYKHGPKSARGAARKVVNQASRIFQNPGGLRLPAPGTKMTVAQAMELARRIGNKDLIRQCQQAARLQKTSDRNTKCVVWKTLPLGSANKIDTVVAMTHYGDSPEDMYRPPKGSKKGAHMYRHKWKRSVPVLASPSGKAIIKVMGPGQKVGDWMRG